MGEGRGGDAVEVKQRRDHLVGVGLDDVAVQHNHNNIENVAEILFEPEASSEKVLGQLRRENKHDEGDKEEQVPGGVVHILRPDEAAETVQVRFEEALLLHQGGVVFPEQLILAEDVEDSEFVQGFGGEGLVDVDEKLGELEQQDLVDEKLEELPEEHGRNEQPLVQNAGE